MQRDAIASTQDWSFRDNRNGIRDEYLESYTQKLYDSSLKKGINFYNYYEIPVTISDKTIPFMESFNDCEVHPQLFQNLQYLQFTNPTPVQQYAIPVSLLRRDLLACAQTGSGKTGAYLYPTIAKMLNDGPPPVLAAGQCLPITLILCPTRELAVQIQDEVLKFTFRTGIKSLVICGGKSLLQQERDALKGCDIIIATPGRLIDLIERRIINLAIVRYLIMDEADKLLDMGFEQQVIRVLTAIKKRDRETTLCSATFPPKIRKIADKYLRDHILLSVGKTGSTSESIKQILHLVRKNDKAQLLINLLEAGGRTLAAVEDLCCLLKSSGIRVLAIHGDKPQHERDFAYRSFKSLENSCLLATDIASRGLDIPNIKSVIIYDVPNNVDCYVHRVGRTGRIGHPGTAHVFVQDKPCFVYRDILEVLLESHQEIPSWFCDLASGNKTCREEDYEIISQTQNNYLKQHRGIDGAYNFSRSSSVVDDWQRTDKRKTIWHTEKVRKADLDDWQTFDSRDYWQENYESVKNKCKGFQESQGFYDGISSQNPYARNSSKQFDLSQSLNGQNCELVYQYEPLTNSNCFNVNRSEFRLEDLKNCSIVKYEDE